MRFQVESWGGNAAPIMTHHATLRAAWREFYRATRLNAACVILSEDSAVWLCAESA
jgi:hypothetical protein